MSRHRLSLWSLLLAVGTQACADLPSPVQPAPSPAAPADIIEPCDPECPVPDGSWPPSWGAPNTLYEAAGDPSPGSPGIWLGANVTPSTCFNNLTPNIVDVDKDWLDDNCEFQLAKAFAPTWGMSRNDGCGQAEPVWAAKYFPQRSPPVVRLAYMPAYHSDCGGGSHYDHRGDSEFVLVEVIWNHSTSHWELRVMFTSAHHGTSIDGSRWAGPAEITFTHRSRGHPMVFVAERKHANYPILGVCGNGVFNFDTCNPGWPYFRFPVHLNRNAGSRFVASLGCIQSTINPTPGLVECWNVQPPSNRFCGWKDRYTGLYATDCAPSYNEWLHGVHFESYEGDWGPGPIAFQDLQTFPRINGPTRVGQWEWNSWWITWDGHAPTSCRWEINFSTVQVGSCTLGWYFSDPGTFYIRAWATREDGAEISAGQYSVMVGSGEIY